MKRLLFFLSMMFFVVSCNNSGTTETKAGDSSKTTEAKTADMAMPYTLSDEPYKDWQPGDKNHAVTVMNSLKGFETGDLAACLAGFGDSVDVTFDGFRQKFSKDSLAKFLTAERARISVVKIYMDDWESVISKDKKTEYVTLWYKQVVTDIKGKVDSMNIVDDCRIKDGKIISLNEKIQRYPPKK